jgi:hypothetical protein
MMAIGEILARLAQGERSRARRENSRRRINTAQAAVAEDLSQPTEYKAEEDYDYDGQDFIE